MDCARKWVRTSMQFPLGYGHIEETTVEGETNFKRKFYSENNVILLKRQKKNSSHRSHWVSHSSCEAPTQCVWVRKIPFRPQPRSPSSLFYHFVVSGGLFPRMSGRGKEKDANRPENPAEKEKWIEIIASVARFSQMRPTLKVSVGKN